MSAAANLLSHSAAFSVAAQSGLLTQAAIIQDWPAITQPPSAVSFMSNRGQLGSSFNPPAGTAQSTRSNHGSPLLPGETVPPPGRAAFDSYPAHFDHIHSMMQSQAHASRITPHIIIKGHAQPLQTMHGHEQGHYLSQLPGM